MKQLLSTVALVGMLAVPSAVAAQTVLGAAAAYHTDLEALGLGGYVTAPLTQLHENISISGNLFYYFPDAFDAFEVNADLIYSFPVSADSPVLPFALAGLNIFRTALDVTIAGVTTSSSSTDLGLNLGGGVVFPAESVRPFVAGKFELNNGTSFVLLGGVGFPLGG